MRTVNEAALKLIRDFEGERLTVYRDPIGLPTVGVGHLVRPSDNLQVGDRITPEQSLAFLHDDLAEAVHTVENAVAVLLTDNQYGALVSLVYNIGAGNFRRSTLLRRLNVGNYSGAASAFASWNKAGGRVLPGLTRRRTAEADLFRTP